MGVGLGFGGDDVSVLMQQLNGKDSSVIIYLVFNLTWLVVVTHVCQAETILSFQV